MDVNQEAFKEEAYELLTELESSLLELEDTPDDSEIIGRVFRAMHTIKGSGAMFGFDDIATFTHEVETVFDLVRSGVIVVNQTLIDLTLAARDQIRTMLDGVDGADEIAASEQKAAEIITALQRLGSDNNTSKAELPELATEVSNGPLEEEITYRIHFVPGTDIFATGTNPIPLLNELRDLGQCHVVAHTDAIPELEKIQPESCYLSWDIILTTSAGINAIKNVFIFVEDDCQIDIKTVDQKIEAEQEEDEDEKKLGEILLDRGEIGSDDLQDALESQKRLGEILIEKAVVDPQAVKVALVEQEHLKEVKAKKRRRAASSNVRVETKRLDNLVDLVGELVIVQARLSQNAASQKDSELLLIAEEVVRLTNELRDNTMSIRMLPIGATFNKFRRLVRDLSRDLGKEIELQTEGSETKLDKTIIDQLNDPLVHLIRNSVDHGIELPEDRRDVGKSSVGHILLEARHSGGYVLIKISDDGAGLDPEILRAKAISKGMIGPDEILTEQETFALLFLAGFSTAKSITDVSGRGVGMDVVKRNIENLRGSIEITSEKGQGTTVTLKLPLTLAIIDGLLVQVGEGFYVIPLAEVEECIELSGEEVRRARARNMMEFRGQAQTYLSIRQRFNIAGDAPASEKVVVVEANGRKIGFAVDQIIGQHQTVIKSVTEIYKDVKGVSGATILGDGTVALILDINLLAQEKG